MRAGALWVVLCLLAGACSTASGASGELPGGEGALAPLATAPPVALRERPAWLESGCSLPLEHLRRIKRGYYRGRSPDVFLVPREPHFFGRFFSTTHSGPWRYVQEVPLVLYGPGFIEPQGTLDLRRRITLADLAPTVARLLRMGWPKERSGRAIKEALVPEAERPRAPRLIVQVVWDGGGWNVLNRWPRAWPYLASVMAGGTSVADVMVGSSPSVTPAIHSTMGTGEFPHRHGVVDIYMRNREGDVTGALNGGPPDELELPTVADVFDRRNDNRPKVGALTYRYFHLGMMSHGGLLRGADRDFAAIAARERGNVVTGPGRMITNRSLYKLPYYLDDVPGWEEDLRLVDVQDGKLDGRWMRHGDLTDPTAVRHSPVWTLYQTRLLKELIAREDFGANRIPDLFFTNYKQVDDVGHDYNMLEPQMREILKYSDSSLQDLTKWLDRKVGERKWVLVFTADHGQQPGAEAIDAWPIGITPLEKDIARRFGVSYERLFDGERPVGVWVDPAVQRAEGITLAEMSDFVLDYTIGDNMETTDGVPEKYMDRRRERLFAAAFPSKKMGKVWDCAMARSASAA
ncbi:MAG: alkaline phosphatase family protein [Actinomycetota bacterium]|nr:alkaline phosphatase family protein [Actinomycetota bacterium]